MFYRPYMGVIGLKKGCKSNQIFISTLQVYKSQIKLLRREYLWAPNQCGCPRLRVRRNYVIMGFVLRHQDRELKLIVTQYAYVRRYSPKQEKRMQKLQEYVKNWFRDICESRYYSGSRVNENVKRWHAIRWPILPQMTVKYFEGSFFLSPVLRFT